MNAWTPRRRGPVEPRFGSKAHRVGEADAVGRGQCVELAHAGVADAALGHVEHALDTDLVGRVDDGAQVRHRVLDLAPVVEASAAHHLVRHAQADERLFHHAGLRVGAVEHRDLAPLLLIVVVQRLDGAGHPRALVVLVVGVVAHDRVAGAQLAPQVLGAARRVVGDDRVGGVEDDLCAAVVLVEHDRGQVLERLLELVDVAHISTPKCVDRLVAVADRGDLAAVLGEQHGQLVLGEVGVLVLVDQDVLEALLVAAQDVGVVAEQLDGLHQQIVEVHRPGPLQPHLVLAVHLGVLAVEDAARRGLDLGLIGVDQLVLPQADDAVHRRGVNRLASRPEVADDVARSGAGRRPGRRC